MSRGHHCFLGGCKRATFAGFPRFELRSAASCVVSIANKPSPPYLHLRIVDPAEVTPQSLSAGNISLTSPTAPPATLANGHGLIGPSSRRPDARDSMHTSCRLSPPHRHASASRRRDLDVVSRPTRSELKVDATPRTRHRQPPPMPAMAYRGVLSVGKAPPA